jgi:hypothetical protein
MSTEIWNEQRYFRVPHLPRDDAERENIVAAYHAGVEIACAMARAWDADDLSGFVAALNRAREATP